MGVRILGEHPFPTQGFMHMTSAAALPKHIHSTGDLPKVAWAKGSYVYDVDGKQYIDGSGGPAVYCIGHSNAEVNAAIKDQLDRIAHGYRYNFSSDALEELTEIIRPPLRRHAQQHGLCDGRFGGGRILPEARAAVSCGAGRDEPQALHRARTLLARQHAGRTVGVGLPRAEARLRGLAARRLAPFARQCLPPRCRAPRLRPWARPARRNWRTRSCAWGRRRSAPSSSSPWWVRRAAACPRRRAMPSACARSATSTACIMISDEVMCGAGRSGTWRALEQDGVEPDIMSVAKGLAAGYLPLGAAIYNDKVADAIHGKHGAPMTGHTFTGHTACCAAGVAVQKIVEREKLVERVHAMEGTLRAMLAEATQGHRGGGRHSRPRLLPGDRAGGGPQDQEALRRRAEAVHEDPRPGLRERAHLLSGGRQRGRDQRRRGDPGAALQRDGCGADRDRGQDRGVDPAGAEGRGLA